MNTAWKNEQNRKDVSARGINCFLFPFCSSIAKYAEQLMTNQIMSRWKSGKWKRMTKQQVYASIYIFFLSPIMWKIRCYDFFKLILGRQILQLVIYKWKTTLEFNWWATQRVSIAYHHTHIKSIEAEKTIF